MRWITDLVIPLLCGGLLLTLVSCGVSPGRVPDYTNDQMDFSGIKTVAVMPFQNLSTDDKAAGRVRDAFMGMLLATEAMYVLPAGEVDRGIDLNGMRNPQEPTVEEIKEMGKILGVEAVITGVLREYGALRSGSAESNMVSLSLRVFETQNGTAVWSASSTKGGITMTDRMLGSGGRPMNDVTTQVINDLLDQFFE